MDRERNTSGGEDHTLDDENRMDRAAQSGTGGAFGVGGSTSGTTGDNMLHDAQETFDTGGDDEQSMDRAAQAGIDGAFGANPEAQQLRDQMRQDAEDAFGSNENK